MAFLIVSGVTVPVLDDGSSGATHSPVGGEVVRMFDNSARTTARAYKRALTVRTALLADSDATTLVTALTSTTQPATCSGDLLGGTVSCITQVTGDTPTYVGGALYRTITFQLHEV